MKELIVYITSLGWYSGEINLQMNCRCSFEGYYGWASEFWEHQYQLSVNQVKIDGKILTPELSMKSKRHESLDVFAIDFLRRIEEEREVGRE